MTQAELAAKLNVSDKTISKWERCAGLPDINSIEPLAEALNISLLELMQAKRCQQNQISTDEAEYLLADTIKLSKRRQSLSTFVGNSILLCYAVIALFLLVLLFQNGFILLYSVLSLLTGLAAWSIPIWHMTSKKAVNTGRTVMISMTFAFAAIIIQVFEISHKVSIGDWASIDDTIQALAIVIIFFTLVTVILNSIFLLTQTQHPKQTVHPNL